MDSSPQDIAERTANENWEAAALAARTAAVRRREFLRLVLPLVAASESPLSAPASESPLQRSGGDVVFVYLDII